MEIRYLKRRVDSAETQLAQITGQFEFISGQLRGVKTYMHNKFTEVDARFDRVEERLERVETKVDALPRVIAEMIGRGQWPTATGAPLSTDLRT